MIMATIFDSAAECYQRPFFCRAVGEATRIFSDLVNDPDHPVGQHPDHYTLFRIGEFSEFSGVIVPCDPVSLGNGVPFVTPDAPVALEA